MQSGRQNTRRWNILVLLVLGLAVAVFAWGLRYKLSLYHSAAPPTRPVAAAKLLSNRERPADIAVEVERATNPVVVTAAFCATFVLFTGLLLDPERQSRWTLQRQLNPQRRPVPEALRQLFFRPPPARR